MEGSVIRLFRFSLFWKGLLSDYSDSLYFGRVCYQIIQILSILEGSVIRNYSDSLFFRKGLLSIYSDSLKFGRVCYKTIQILFFGRVCCQISPFLKALLSVYSDFQYFRTVCYQFFAESLFLGRVCYKFIQILIIWERSVVSLFRFLIFQKGLLSVYTDFQYFRRVCYPFYIGKVCYQLIQTLLILEGSVISLFRFSLFCEGSVIRLFKFTLFWKGLLSEYSDSLYFGRVCYQFIQILSISKGRLSDYSDTLFRKGLLSDYSDSLHFGRVCYQIIQRL